MSARRPTYYSRLFPRHHPGYPHHVLSELAERMKDTLQNRGERVRMPGSVPSSYVYFGQFINHDLSRDITKPTDLNPLEPEATRNERTARLDLEPLYGEGLTDGNVVYDGDKLGLGQTLSEGTSASSDNDLPRDSEGIAIIPDPRNDLTLLVAQLHVLLIKFHNRIVDDLVQGNIPSAGPGDGSLFEQARRITTWHYQWLVRNDFLPALVAPDVLQDIITHWPRLYRPKQGQATVPVEFAWAAFQYGHSAVQNVYNINRESARLTLEETFYITGRGGLAKPNEFPKNVQLPQRYVVDCGRMFGWAPPGVTNTAEEIDTLIASDFFKVPIGFVLILLGADPEWASKARGNETLTEVTLRRGAGIGIPSGQEACRIAGVQPLSPDQLGDTDGLKRFLHRKGLLYSTPLFYYLLREAETAGRVAHAGKACKRLGPLGSRIVAEVLLGILQADPRSFVHFAWQPPLIQLQQNRAIRIDSLKKLALYASGRAM